MLDTLLTAVYPRISKSDALREILLDWCAKNGTAPTEGDGARKKPLFAKSEKRARSGRAAAAPWRHGFLVGGCPLF